MTSLTQVAKDTLSIVIVSYNVSAFLEQCLESVLKAAESINARVYVVDNNSVDGSVAMVRSKFPSVELIESQENLGFSRGNNLAFRQIDSPFILMLNPDTIVHEDTLSSCLEFMESHPDAGAIGVKMIDGSGRYLPESKRGFPSPFAAFCKLSGLSKIFPRSNLFNAYYLGGLDPDQTNRVDVLSGAFMFIRSEALSKAGYLDEDYFMYGEDIDLSYRITQEGYQNYYFPQTSIIHFKGESTKKASVQYTRNFYQAMLVFLRKHVAHSRNSPFVLLMQLGIFLRGALSGVRHLLQRAFPVLMDTLMIAAGLFGIKHLWARYYYDNLAHFDQNFDTVNLPIYTGLWVLFFFLMGAYDRYYSAKRILLGTFWGAVTILVVYAMLPMDFRSSRAVILLAAFWTFFGAIVLRMLGHYFHYRSFALSSATQKKVLIVASRAENERIMDLLSRSNAQINVLGVIAPEDEKSDSYFLNTLKNLREVVDYYDIDELIFSSQDVPFRIIMEWMLTLGPEIEYKLISEQSTSIVGSKSRDASGDLYSVDILFRITDPLLVRNKRIFDVLATLSLTLLLPLLLMYVRKRSNIAANLWSVFRGKKSWVSYDRRDVSLRSLPPLRPGVLAPRTDLTIPATQATIHLKNFLYAKEYGIWKDIEILINNLRDLGD